MISWVSVALLFIVVAVQITDTLALPIGSLVAPAAVLGAALGFGAQKLVQDLLAGQIQVVFTSLPSVAGLIRSGQVRALAVTSGRRNAGFPDIPTIAESGYPGFDVTPWFGIVARAGTPPAVIQKVNADVRETLAGKDVADKLASLGADALVTSPEEFAAIIRTDIAKWSEAVRASGARVD